MIPPEYEPQLDRLETQQAIHTVKDSFASALAGRLDLTKVTAPRFIKTGTGLQDDLDGTQKPVSFAPDATRDEVEFVHSLAKWKRYMLGELDLPPGRGIYTDMEAIRQEEEPTPEHSVAVDQWDWERVMTPDQRNTKYLRRVVEHIFDTFREAEQTVQRQHGLEPRLPGEITFVHAQDLEDRWPEATPEQREDRTTAEHGAVFLRGVGHPLKSGEPHDPRAADYDDWITDDGGKGLNGDILVWDDIRETALELSSMGIRVDADSLKKQLAHHDELHKRELAFHRTILDGDLPQTVGGGIGQSRTCMYLLHKAHIGEVQASVWPEEHEERCRDSGVELW